MTVKQDTITRYKVFPGVVVLCTYQPTERDKTGCDGLYVKSVEMTVMAGLFYLIWVGIKRIYEYLTEKGYPNVSSKF